MSKPPVRQYSQFHDEEPSLLVIAIFTAIVVVTLITIFYLLGGNALE